MIIDYNLSVEHGKLFTANNAIKMTFYRANENRIETHGGMQMMHFFQHIMLLLLQNIVLHFRE
jgi:hypothetical protein